MAIGKGKYDDICTIARAEADALAAIVIIIGGKKGSGFSVQALESAHAGVMTRLPDLLRSMADEISADMASGVTPFTEPATTRAARRNARRK